MDLATLNELLSPTGDAALAAAAGLQPTEAKYPAALDRLRKQFPEPLARAALDTVLLRAKARAKFRHADRMVFDREGLEMASGEAVAAYRAGRFVAGFRSVADLGCGVGGDAIAFAAAGLTVTAVDRDPVRLRMAEANVAAQGLSGRFVCGDVLTVDLAGCEAAFADPGRRPGGKRVRAVDAGEPPLSALVARFPAGFPLAVKLAPGVRRTELADFDADPEFIAADGELKECVLWFGPFRTGQPRAVLLPGPHVLTGEPGDPLDSGPVGAYLFDPDPAAVRADLLGELARQLGAWPVEPGYAVLSGDELVANPFATAYRVEEVLPLDVKRVGALLRERGVGRVTLLNRASTADADAIGKKWKLTGNEHRTVVLTRAGDKQVAVIGVRM
ncbi:MAG: class I SAM-dependent methyltransferase [Gemmataceae bacterium]